MNDAKSTITLLACCCIVLTIAPSASADYVGVTTVIKDDPDTTALCTEGAFTHEAISGDWRIQTIYGKPPSSLATFFNSNTLDGFPGVGETFETTPTQRDVTTFSPRACLTLIHEGSGSGTLDGEPFPTSDFVITAFVDTDDRESPGSFGWAIDHLSASIWIDGLGDLDFVTPTRHFVNNNSQVVGFSRAGNATPDLFNGPTDAVFGTWDMLGPIGPISGEGQLFQWTTSPLIDTTTGILIFDTEFGVDATFTAVVKCGECGDVPDGSPCDDGDACTVKDQCIDGVCSGVPINCDDFNVCTDDDCDPDTGCTYTPNNGPCDDGDACTVGDHCGDDGCVHGGGPLDCDDGNECTDDGCDPDTGCTHVDIECPKGQSCDPASGECIDDQDPCECVNGRVTLCHIPPGNRANARTITVGCAAGEKHLAHGDTCGSCE